MKNPTRKHLIFSTLFMILIFAKNIFASPTLLFTGKNLQLRDEKGTIIQSWAAGTGRPFTSSRNQSLKNRGPLPEGKYTVALQRTVFFDRNNSLKARLNWLAKYIAWGDLAIPLDPLPTNQMFGRHSFMIHGGGWIVGSQGCIYVYGKSNDIFKRLSTLNQPTLPLEVTYAPQP